MSASKNLGKVFMTPKGIWDKTLNYTKLDIVTNKVGKISCGYIATTDIEKNVEITDNRWLKLFELLDGDLTEEYKAVQTDVANKATDVDANKKAVDLIYSQMQKLYDVEISTTTPTNERTGLWINPDDISGVINIPEIKDDEVSDVDTWSSKKIDNVTGSLKDDISTKITKFYASSQGENHLADSDNGKIQDMMLYGKSEQKRYSGKNLLNATLQTTIVNGVTCTANGDGTYTLNGTATTTTTFDIAQDVSCSSFRLVGCPVGGAHDASYELQARTNNLIYGYDTGDGKNIKADENFFIRIRINTGINCNNLLFKPMIVDASLYPDATYDDFEPYTGGIPSPNPDYPQEIKSVVNPTVKVCGKNLFDSKKFPIILNRAIDTNTGVVYESSGGKYCATEKYIPFPYGGKIISFNDSMSLCAYDKDYKFISAIRYHSQAPFGTTYVRFDIKIEDKDKAQIELSESTTTYEPYHEQTVTLPYTLNAIPVSSGGNVTIDGQQYIADYVDVERGKVVKRVKVLNISNLDKSKWGFRTDTSEAIGHSTRYYGTSSMLDFDTNINAMSNIAIYGGIGHDAQGTFRLVDAATYLYQFNLDKTKFDKVQDFTDYLASNNVYIQYALKVPQELDLKPEEIVLFKSLSANYPVTNIFINSEQLDGYTVFNYPIPFEDEWNKTKKDVDSLKEDLEGFKGSSFTASEQYSENVLDNDNGVMEGWNAKVPVYLKKNIRYLIGMANSTALNPGVAINIIDESGSLLQVVKQDYTQIPTSNGVPFESTIDGKFYMLFKFIEGGITAWKKFMVIKAPQESVAWAEKDFVPFSCKKTYTANIAEKANQIQSRYYDKTHLSFGDSITEQAVWQSYFRKYLGTKMELIKGYSGQALWKNCSEQSLEEKLGNTQFDFATVMFGTNDWGQSRQIGSNSDTNDNGEYTGTFKGSLNTFFKNMTTKFPSKPFIMVTPPNGFEDLDYNNKPFSDNGRKNLLGLSIKDYADAIKELSAMWGIPCFDFNSVCGWNYINKSIYLKSEPNGTYIHPNGVGGQEYAYKLARFCEMN